MANENESRNPALEAAEQNKLAAEVLLIEQKTRKAAVEAQIAEEALWREHSSQDAHRIYTFAVPVTANSAQGCIATLGQWHREDPTRPIEIVFNSPGGGVFPGLALFDYIKELQANGHEINTVAVGMAASMAGILLQAGDKRTVGRNAYIMIHEISSLAVGNASELDDEVKFVKRLQKRALDILAERSTLSRNQISRRWKRKDWWLDAEEAVELGFADAIR